MPDITNFLCVFLFFSNNNVNLFQNKDANSFPNNNLNSLNYQNNNGNSLQSQNNNNFNPQNNHTSQNFEDFYKIVQSQSFNDTKIEMITTQSRNTRWRTEEIKRLLQLLSFENEKLEVAKTCYHTCIDKQNYFNLFNVFTFDSSVKELNKYINGTRN